MLTVSIYDKTGFIYLNKKNNIRMIWYNMIHYTNAKKNEEQIALAIFVKDMWKLDFHLCRLLVY